MLPSDPPVLASHRHAPETHAQPEISVFQVPGQFQMAVRCQGHLKGNLGYQGHGWGQGEQEA